MKNSKGIRFKSFTFFSLLAVSFEANAYFDPGTGGMLIQSAIAGLVMLGAFLRNFRLKIFKIFHNIAIKFRKKIPIETNPKVPITSRDIAQEKRKAISKCKEN